MNLNRLSEQINAGAQYAYQSLYIGVDALIHHEVLDNAALTSEPRLGHIALQTLGVALITGFAVGVLFGPIAAIFAIFVASTLAFASLTGTADHAAAARGFIQALRNEAHNILDNGLNNAGNGDITTTLGGYIRTGARRLDQNIVNNFPSLRARDVAQRPWHNNDILSRAWTTLFAQG